MYLTILWPTSRFGKANFLSNNPLGTNKMEKGERKETKQEEIRHRGKKKEKEHVDLFPTTSHPC